MATRRSKKSPGAIDPYKGFVAQTTRMALLLLQSAPGSVVSLEHLDDIGVHNPDGTQVASQMKVGSTNPVTDRAVPLWKTFANWVRQVRAGQIDPTVTIFELHVAKAKPGKLVLGFSNAKAKASVDAAFLEARRLLWGESPDFEKQAEVAPTLAPHLEEIFGSTAGARAFKSVVARFRLTIAGKNAVDELVYHAEHVMGILPAALEKVLNHYHGWLDLNVQKQIAATGKPAFVSRAEAWREFHTFYHSITSGGILPDLAKEPTNADYTALLGFPFMRQLQLVKADAATERYAMTTFFKAGAMRTLWVDHDYIHADSVAMFEEQLMQAHRDYQALMEGGTQTAEQRGRMLLAHCHQHRCPVDQKDPPDYFVPGCYHLLADRLRLGWHPDYMKLLQSVA